MNNLLQRLALGTSATALLAATPFGAAFAQGDQIEQDAFANIVDSVRDLPQVSAPPSSFSASQAASSAGTVGANLINLRSLGVVRTLVLYDNARVVASNLGT